jgi:hypothetical protein
VLAAGPGADRECDEEERVPRQGGRGACAGSPQGRDGELTAGVSRAGGDHSDNGRHHEPRYEGELREFLAILNIERGLGAVDDTLTALWDRHFEHIAYLAIDSFAEGDAPDKDAFQADCQKVGGKIRALAQIDKDWDEQNLEGRALQLNIAAALAESGEAASSLSIDPMTRATLGAQLSGSAVEWDARYVDAFAEAHLEATRYGDVDLLSDALAEWTGDQIALKSYGAVFRFMASIVDAFGGHLDRARAKAAGEGIAKTMLPVQKLGLVLTSLAADLKGARDKGQAAPVDPDLAPGIARRLAIGDDEGSLFGVAGDCFEAVPNEELGRVLLDYLRHWRTGREPLLGALLARAGRDAALAVLALLAEDKSAKGLAAIEAALKNPSVEVRIEGLSHLPETQADRVRDEVQKIVEDGSPDVRAQALGKIGAIRLVAAGPALVQRIRDASFHALAVDERRWWFDAVFKLNARRGETLAIELLEEHPVIPREAIDQTRVLAADLLAGASSKEALEAAEGASKSRFWNSAGVREAAARAASAIAARRAAGGATEERRQ